MVKKSEDKKEEGEAGQSGSSDSNQRQSKTLIDLPFLKFKINNYGGNEKNARDKRRFKDSEGVYQPRIEQAHNTKPYSDETISYYLHTERNLRFALYAKRKNYEHAVYKKLWPWLSTEPAPR